MNTIALQALSGLTPPMLEALERMGRRAVTAAEIGFKGETLRGLERRGLVEADRAGLPTMYRLNTLGRVAVDILDTDPVPDNNEQPVERIKRLVAETFRIPLTEMVSQRRSRDIARPRQIAMYLARETTPLSLPNIGKRFGNRDHTTVLHGIRQIENLIETDEETRERVASLMAALGYAPELTDEEREQDAVEGSAKLRDAILGLSA